MNEKDEDEEEEDEPPLLLLEPFEVPLEEFPVDAT